MINLLVNGIENGSTVLEIEAAVLRVMEKSNIHPHEIDMELTEAKTDGFLVMVFLVKELSIEKLEKLHSEFGGNFRLIILAKNKSGFFLQVEAPKDDFLYLAKRQQNRTT